MIGQVAIGKSFGGVVRYVMQKQSAEVLEQICVRAINTPLSFTYQDNLSKNK